MTWKYSTPIQDLIFFLWDSWALWLSLKSYRIGVYITQPWFISLDEYYSFVAFNCWNQTIELLLLFLCHSCSIQIRTLFRTCSSSWARFTPLGRCFRKSDRRVVARIFLSFWVPCRAQFRRHIEYRDFSLVHYTIIHSIQGITLGSLRSRIKEVATSTFVSINY